MFVNNKLLQMVAFAETVPLFSQHSFYKILSPAIDKIRVTIYNRIRNNKSKGCVEKCRKTNRTY